MKFPIGDNAQPHRVVKKRVLILDDNRTLAEILAMSLNAMGFEATAYASPGEALRQIQNFDVLVSTYEMPEMTGLEVAKRAHALGWRGSLFLMSGRREKWTEVTEHPLLCSFLQKPFSGSELGTVLRTLD